MLNAEMIKIILISKLIFILAIFQYIFLINPEIVFQINHKLHDKAFDSSC